MTFPDKNNKIHTLQQPKVPEIASDQNSTAIPISPDRGRLKQSMHMSHYGSQMLKIHDSNRQKTQTAELKNQQPHQIAIKSKQSQFELKKKVTTVLAENQQASLWQVKKVGQASLTGQNNRLRFPNQVKPNQDSFLAHKIPKSQLNAFQEWLFCVADGHGTLGHMVSQFITSNIAAIFQQERRKVERRLILKSKKIEAKHFEKIIKVTFHSLQDKLERQTNFDIQESGSTLTMVYFQKQFMVAGNSGDSKTLFLGQLKFDLPILVETRDHKPEDKDEAARVQAANGQINTTAKQTRVAKPSESQPMSLHQAEGPLRVWVPGELTPGLAMTRSLGDMNGKNCGVIAEPETYFQDLIFQEDSLMHPEYLVLATDGVWDFLKPQQIRQVIQNNKKLNAQALAELISADARQRWISSCRASDEECCDIDDVTILVIQFTKFES